MGRCYMKKITILVLCLMCLAGCSSGNTSSILQKAPEAFCDNYEQAKFKELNSPASQNGLGGTAVWIEGKITDYFSFYGEEEYSDFEYYCGVLIDNDNNKWLLEYDANVMLLEEDKEKSVRQYQDLKNHNVVICGIYQGYSDVIKAPAVEATKIYDADDDATIMTGWGRTDADSPEYDAVYLLKVTQQHEESNQSVDKNDVKPDDSATSQESTSSSTATAITSSDKENSNALNKALSYLKHSAFSYNGLIEQLEYEGFSTESATYAVDNCGADWNEQASKKAKQYLNSSAFSYSGLIEQLEYDGFSTESATYAADNCGADWNEQAAKKAQSYINHSSFSRDGLIEQLEYEGFSPDQAEYGATAVGY